LREKRYGQSSRQARENCRKDAAQGLIIDRMVIEVFADNSVDPPVRGFLHRPERPSANALILTHGAGGNAQMDLLVALAEAFTSAGFTVLRCNLPFRQKRPFGPPRPAEAERDRAGLKNAITAINKKLPGRVFLGGQSYGGRQASILLAEDQIADGLLLLSYPLHAPSRPDQPRTQHLPNLQVPTLFVQGSRDPFGTIEEIQAALKLIPAKTELVVVEGAGHDLGFKDKVSKGELPGKILQAFLKLFG
jgi:predicted alpha/beta-hydrolase family hydrolase